MRHKKICVLLIIGIIMVLIVFFILKQFHTIFYENFEFPLWTDISGTWSYDDEKWLMRGFDSSKSKKRNVEIVNRYYLGDALCYIGIRAKNESTTYSRNPYNIGITVYGLPNRHTSFTIRKITVNSRSGNNLSFLANNNLPVTVLLENESQTEEMLVWGYYNTDEIFNFKNEPIIIEFTLEINGIGGSKTGDVVVELKPVNDFSLLLVFAYSLGA
jgi:hypothetical protein